VKQTLYKYMPVQNEDYLDRLRRILQGRIYYSSPTSFNDPFEMSALFDIPDHENVMELINNSGPDAGLLSKSARARIFQHVKATLGTNNVVSRDWIESIGVLCLTTTADDLLMWAHYAANHTGICLSSLSIFAVKVVVAMQRELSNETFGTIRGRTAHAA
jgi:hypothetical protein